MDLSAESQVVSDCLWDSRKIPSLGAGPGKCGSPLGKFRLIFTRLLTDADQVCWTKTGVSKVRLRTDLAVLLNEEILTYVTVYLQLPFNLVGFAFDQQPKRSDIF